MGVLVERDLPTLYGGVSRQPNPVRRANQVEANDNALSSVFTGGFEKRPSTQHLAKLTGLSAAATYAVHEIDRSETEQHLIMLTDEDIKVFDAITGAAQTVNVSDSKHYFQIEQTGVDSLQILETPDTQGLASALRVEQLAFDASETTVSWDFVLSDASVTFKIEGSADNSVWNDIATGKTGASGSFTTTLDAVATGDHNYIRVTVTAVGTSGATDTLTLTGTFKSLSYLINSNEEDFAFVSVADHTFISNRSKKVRIAEASSGTVTSTVQEFTDLPANSGSGNIHRVQGTDADGFATFYVIDDATTSTWIETVDPNAHNDFALHTMPYSLVREADATWTFRPTVWAARGIGDEDVTEAPVFVDKEIADVFFFRNRLGVLSDDSIYTSRSKVVLDFWPEKAVDVLDTDPIERGAPATEVAILQWAAVFRKILFVTAERNQFEMTALDTFTPKTAVFDLATSYRASPAAKPKTMGDVLYFPAAGVNNAVLYEYFFDESSLANDAADITAHIVDYIPNDVIKISTDVTTGTMFVLTSGEQNSVYVYKTFFDGSRKVQSAWGRYIFAPTEADGLIHGMAVMSGFLVLIIERADGFFLEQMPIAREAIDTDLGYAPLIDQRDILTGVYDSGNDCTTWTTEWEGDDDAIVILGGSFSEPGRIPAAFYPDCQTLTFATVLVDDSITINGQVITAKTATDTSAYEFDQSGNDIADAAAFTLVVNDATDGITGVTATDNLDGTVTLDVDDSCDDSIVLADISSTITAVEVKDKVAARGDFSGGSSYVGRPYTMTVTLSKPYIRATAADDSSAVLNGRFQLKDLRVQYQKTGYFRIEVTPENRDTNTFEFSGRTLGGFNPVGTPAIATEGSHSALILGNAKTTVISIINDEPVPSVITAGVFRGFFNELTRQE